MNAYQNLAASYDRLTNDVDYAGWVDFAQEILKREDLSPKTVADHAEFRCQWYDETTPSPAWVLQKW